MRKIIQIIKQQDFFASFKHGSNYTIAFFVIQLISFFSLPVVTHLLEPKDFGIVEVFLQLTRILGILFSLNLYTGLSRYIYDKDMDRSQLVGFTFSVATLFSIACSAIFYFCWSWLAPVLQMPPGLFWLIVTYVWLNNITGAFFTAICYADNKSLLFSVWSVAVALFKVGLSIVLLIYWQQNYLGRIYGEVIATSVVMLLTLVIFMRKYITINITFPHYKEVLSYSLGFIPITLSGFILTYFDTMMINAMKGNTDAGLYSFAYKVAIIYTGVSSAFLTSVKPKLFNELNNGNIANVYKEQQSAFKLITFLNISFLLVSKDIGMLLSFNPAYLHALNILPFILLGCIFFDATELFNFFINYYKKISLFFFTVFFSAGVNILLNYLLIPVYGYKIAAITTLISYAVLFVMTYIICRRYLLKETPASLGFILTRLLLFIPAIGVFYLLEYLNYPVIISLLIKSVLILALFLFSYYNIIKNILQKT